MPSVTPVEPDPIAGVKPMHRSREAQPRPQFQLQMIVVGHQYIGVDPYAKALRKLPPVAAENLRTRSRKIAFR